MAGLAFIRRHYRYLVIAVVLFLFGLILFMPLPSGLNPDGQKALAIFFLCATFWITGVLPLMITSLLAIVLFPLMGVLDARTTYSLFGNQAVFFILGAFILASALMRSGLSARLTLLFINRFGRSSRSLLLSVFLLPAFLSCWMSNHAVAAMMLPVILEITEGLGLRFDESRYGKALFLALGWGCVIGGITTFLGGARAPLAVGILQEITGQEISFGRWALAALPMVLISLGAAYPLLLKLFPPEIDDVTPAVEVIRRKVDRLGHISRREVAVGVLMLATIAAWMFAGQTLGLANIALLSVILAFTFNLLRWKEVEEDVNWGVFLMYGGAICLGFAIDKTGAANWLAQHLIQYGKNSPLVIICGISLASIVLTAAISNSAVVAMLVPMALSLAAQLHLNFQAQTLLVTLASGLAFMLPISTPAMAIAFSSGFIHPKDTLVGGGILSILCWLLLCLSAIFWWPVLGLRL